MADDLSNVRETKPPVILFNQEEAEPPEMDAKAYYEKYLKNRPVHGMPPAPKTDVAPKG